jgi:hypothetical protein
LALRRSGVVTAGGHLPYLLAGILACLLPRLVDVSPASMLMIRSRFGLRAETVEQAELLAGAAVLAGPVLGCR